MERFPLARSDQFTLPWPLTSDTKRVKRSSTPEVSEDPRPEQNGAEEHIIPRAGSSEQRDGLSQQEPAHDP
jgi:hypothetical protein